MQPQTLSPKLPRLLSSESQEFSADMNSRPVKRIEDVAMLRVAQFSEDSGPMAHPIRPESYIKVRHVSPNYRSTACSNPGAAVIQWG